MTKVGLMESIFDRLRRTIPLFSELITLFMQVHIINKIWR